MTDKIQKALSQFNAKDRKTYREILERLGRGDWDNLDIQPLRGRKDEFRVRFGRHRLIFILSEGEIYIQHLGPRNEHTYKK